MIPNLFPMTCGGRTSLVAAKHVALSNCHMQRSPYALLLSTSFYLHCCFGVWILCRNPLQLACSIFKLVSRADCLATFFVAFNVAGVLFIRLGRNNCLSWAFSYSDPFLDDLFANSLDQTRKYWMILQTSKKLQCRNVDITFARSDVRLVHGSKLCIHKLFFNSYCLNLHIVRRTC